MSERSIGTDTVVALSDERIHRGWRAILARQETGLIIVLLTMCTFLTITTDTFLTARNIFNILLFFSWIAISAYGQTLVVLTGGIDLSVGSNIALSGFVSAWLLATLGDKMDPTLVVIVAVLGGLATGTLIGITNGGLVTRFRLPPFIATLGMLGIARGITLGVSNGWPIRDLPETFKQIGQSNLMVGTFGVGLPVIFMLVAAIIVSLFLSETVSGRHIYAVGGNEEAVRVSGASPLRTKMLVYSACGLLTALAGIIMTARLGVAAPDAARGWELSVIAAVVIGGTSLFGGEGTILGTLLGAAIMQVLRNGLVLAGIPAYWQEAFIGAVLVLAAIFDQWRKGRSLLSATAFTGAPTR
jgi:ribose transport system permease protein